MHVIIIKKNLDCETDPRDVHSHALTAFVTATRGVYQSLAKYFPTVHRFPARDGSMADVNCTFHVG